MKELQKEIRLSRNSILVQIKKGMPYMKAGSKYLFDLKDVTTWLKEKK